MKKFIIIFIIIGLFSGGILWYVTSHKGAVMQKTIQSMDHVLKLEQLDDSTREQFGVIQDIANTMLTQDDVVRRYLLLLQNNLELRPGGGFIGQYAVVRVKNGEILSFDVKDSNILDNTYKSDRELPEKLQKYLIGTRKWKFRDSNYSPHYPENVENALHFYGLSGNDANFDGVFAINATLFEDLLEISGPISLTKKDWEKYGEFTSEGGLMKLEKIVEEPFFRAEERKACEKKLKKASVPENDDRWEACRYDENGKKKKKVTHGQREARKDILDAIAEEMLLKLLKIDNIEPLIIMATKALDQKDVQLWFKDKNLQNLAQKAHWTGEVDQEWKGDYVMISDANIGALKSDYYMKRTMEYKVDFTGKSAEANDALAGRMVRYISDDVKNQVMNGTFVTKLPLATVRMTYENTATETSNYNSDYHSFTRLYVPKGSTWYVREWFEPPGVDTEDIFGGNKQMYGYKFDVLLGDTIPTMLQYTLPSTISEENYKLKIQKQSGIGNIPLKVIVITSDGIEHIKEITFEHDIIFELRDGELIIVD
ncbi:MAG: hypothetical protein CR972_00085 [Candidatus Moraniibacteriota bacterium]|nr:MAG: hypothetical protein CR972_00085 [Candidatus Moranbacteria bacterium]